MDFRRDYIVRQKCSLQSTRIWFWCGISNHRTDYTRQTLKREFIFSIFFRFRSVTGAGVAAAIQHQRKRFAAIAKYIETITVSTHAKYTYNHTYLSIYSSTLCDMYLSTSTMYDYKSTQLEIK